MGQAKYSPVINDYAPVCDRLADLAEKSLTGEALTEDDANGSKITASLSPASIFTMEIRMRFRAMIFRW